MINFPFSHMTVEGVRCVRGSVVIMQTPAISLWPQCEFKLLMPVLRHDSRPSASYQPYEVQYINYVVVCVGFSERSFR